MLTGQRLTAIVAALALVIAGGAVMVALSSQDGGSPGQVAQAQTIGEDRGIAVDGEGQISVQPDTARVTLGIEAEGQDIGAMREDANSRMNTVIDALQDAGISEEDIQTVAYDISVQRDDHPPEPVPEGSDEDGSADEGPTTYRLIQLVRVTVHDIDQTGDIIDLALDEGANRVNGVHFEVEDREGAIAQARELAVENARQKAEHLAELTGVSLGAPLAIQDHSPGLPAVSMDVAAVEREMAADGAAPIQPGESTISVNVRIVYAIE